MISRYITPSKSKLQKLHEQQTGWSTFNGTFNTT